MGFDIVSKGGWGNRPTLVNAVTVEPASRTQFRLTISADIAARFGAAAWCDVYLGRDEDFGSLRIVPCETPGENTYRLRRSKSGHAAVSLSRARCGVEKEAMPKHTVHAAFRVSDTAVTVHLPELFRRRAPLQAVA